LGLNTTALGELIEHCPETCNIPCGSFYHFSISVSFHLSNIPGLLDSSSKKILEDSSLEFITFYVDSKESDPIIFELDKVELTSQSVVEPTRHLRSLNTQAVEVSVLFDGFTIGLTNDEVSELLVSGIDSSAFTAVLQKSDKVFSVAMISSASEVDSGISAGIEEDGKTGASTATVVV
jgi:hypothetical protein